MMIYFAPMEGITDGILRRTHQEIFGGVDVYCLPFHKLTHTLSVKTRIGVEDPGEWPAILQVLSRYPFEHVTIHVRTTREQYTGGIHPDAFALALRQGLPHPVYNGDLRRVQDITDLLNACPGTDAVMIGRGLLADPALARQLQGGSPASRDELRAWYTALYRGWEQRFQHTIALGRIKKMAELAGHDDIQQKRLLRRAESIEECIEALTDREE